MEVEATEGVGFSANELIRTVLERDSQGLAWVLWALGLRTYVWFRFMNRGADVFSLVNLHIIPSKDSDFVCLRFRGFGHVEFGKGWGLRPEGVRMVALGLGLSYRPLNPKFSNVYGTCRLSWSARCFIESASKNFAADSASVTLARFPGCRNGISLADGVD